MNYLQNEQFNLQANITQLSSHKPRVLILYGSLRENSYSQIGRAHV